MVKLHQLQNIHHIIDYDIIVFSEIWLNSIVLNSELSENLFMCNRSDRKFELCGVARGGEVVISTRSNLNSFPVSSTIQ